MSALKRRLFGPGVAFALTCAGASHGRAGELYQDGALDLRWDNTFRYSAAARLSSADAALIANPNGDDGDRNFAPGIVSNRMDVLSELDLTDGDFGVRVSGAGWFDTVYQQRTDNHSPSTYNPISVSNEHFTQAVRGSEGQDGWLSDAFIHGSFDLGEMPVSFRIGRHTLLWGESLFFASNGIAAGQAPIDADKALSQPAAEAREVFLPVSQASAVFLPAPNVALSLYYQFGWRKDRLPGAGSYFSSGDILDAGGERLFLDPKRYLLRAPDLAAPGSGQYGASLQVTDADFNYGFYALRYNGKDPQVYLRPDNTVPAGDVGTYQLVYPRGIEIYGASFSGYLGDSNIAGEISARRNMPLVSGPLIASPGLVADVSTHPLYAIGDTLHAQVSTVSLFPATTLWGSGSLAAEIAANDVMNVTRNPSVVAPARDRFAASFRANFTPQYFQVLPNLDLGVPIGFGIGMIGKSGIDSSQNAGGGDAEIGIAATYRSVWQANLTLTHFVGQPAIQSLVDRDFIAFSVQRTF